MKLQVFTPAQLQDIIEEATIDTSEEQWHSNFLKGVAGKEAGMDQPPTTVSEAAVEVLANEVEKIGESETVKKVLKDLADGEPSSTNEPAPLSSDTLIDILGEQVDEIGENEELKDELKNLGKWLFGK